MTITGSDFENLVEPFFRDIFEKMDFLVIQVRNQNSGNQNGFDISVLFLDDNDIEREIFIECKYYTSAKLNWADIFNKQLQLEASNHNPTAFILLSPLRNLSNIDHDIQAKVIKDFKYPVDFWTPDKEIDKLFALSSAVYEKIYDKGINDIIINPEAEIQKYRTLINLLIKKRNSLQVINLISTKKDSIINIGSNEFKTRVIERITLGDIETALKIMFDYTYKVDSEYNSIITLLRSQYSELNKNKILNVSSVAENNVQYNRIANSVLNLLDRIC